METPRLSLPPSAATTFTHRTAKNATLSAPPCGEELEVGVAQEEPLRPILHHPHPYPSPQGGGENVLCFRALFQNNHGA